MLNLISSTNSQIELKNSVWMFNADFSTFYSDRFDFVRFNDKDEIEYLNGKGEILRKDTLEIDSKGIYKIKGNPFFKGVEFVNSTEINLVFETEYTKNDEYQGKKDMRLNLTKLIPTKIEVDQDELSKIQIDSEWELIQPKGKRDTFSKFTQWKEIPKDEMEKAIKDSNEYRKHKKYRHLIKIEDTIIAVQQKLDMIHSKAIVSKITDKEIILVNHFKDNEEYILKRVN